jgi:AcrR family transcriptional regulator
MASYHHGDLRRAVLDAALELIGRDGPGGLSMRDLARRAGVSHAAPAHHFKDKAGLLTAIAVEGHELLAASLAGPPGDSPDLRELGVRYVRFALAQPAHFEVMFRPDLYHRDAPELLAARQRTDGLLQAGMSGLPRGSRGGDEELARLAVWSLAHGFATLWRGDNVARIAGDRDPAQIFRAIAGLAFTGGSA